MAPSRNPTPAQSLPIPNPPAPGDHSVTFSLCELPLGTCHGWLASFTCVILLKLTGAAACPGLHSSCCPTGSPAAGPRSVCSSEGLFWVVPPLAVTEGVVTHIPTQVLCECPFGSFRACTRRRVAGWRPSSVLWGTQRAASTAPRSGVPVCSPELSSSCFSFPLCWG